MSEAAAANPTDAATAAPAASTEAPAATPASTEPANAFAAALALVPNQTGDAAPAAVAPAANADPLAGVPEKHRVYTGEGDARVLDQAATLAKVASAYTSLETRFGAGERAVPETADGYKLNVSDEIAAIVPPAELAANEGFKSFMGKMHAAGFSQEQVDIAVSELLTQSLALQDRVAEKTYTECKGELQKVWTTEADYNGGMVNFAKALTAFAGDAKAAELGAKYGNDAEFVQLMAKVGKELGEDAGHPRIQPQMSETDLAILQRPGGPYWDAKHPEHASYVAQVNRHFERTAGNRPVQTANALQTFTLNKG